MIKNWPKWAQLSTKREGFYWIQQKQKSWGKEHNYREAFGESERQVHERKKAYSTNIGLWTCSIGRAAHDVLRNHARNLDLFGGFRNGFDIDETLIITLLGLKFFGIHPTMLYASHPHRKAARGMQRASCKRSYRDLNATKCTCALLWLLAKHTGPSFFESSRSLTHGAHIVICLRGN